MAELVRYYSGGWWVKNVFMNRAHTKTKIINNNTNQISMNDPNSRSGSFFVWPNLWLDVQAWLSRHDDMAIFCLGVSVFGLMALTNKVSLSSMKATDDSAWFAERVGLAQVAGQAKPKWNNEIKCSVNSRRDNGSWLYAQFAKESLIVSWSKLRAMISV